MPVSERASEESRAQRLAQMAATLMSGWLASHGEVPFSEAPIREMVELAEKIQLRAERRAGAEGKVAAKD